MEESREGSLIGLEGEVTAWDGSTPDDLDAAAICSASSTAVPTQARIHERLTDMVDLGLVGGHRHGRRNFKIAQAPAGTNFWMRLFHVSAT